MAEELIRVNGVEEVCAWLDKAPDLLFNVALIRGLHAAGEVIERAIDLRAAKHEREIRIGGDAAYPAMILGLKLKVALYDGKRAGNAQIGFFGYAASVANWVEFGHRIVLPSQTETYVDDRGRRRRGKYIGRDVPEYPFMRPAADESTEAAMDAFVGAVDETVAQFNGA